MQDYASDTSRNAPGAPAAPGSPTAPAPTAARPAGRPASRRLARVFRIIASIVLVVAVLAAGRAYQSYLVATRPPAPQRAVQEQPRWVESATAGLADVQPTLKVYGQIAAGRSVDLRMLVGGEVKSVAPQLVDGGTVQAGEVLVKVDPFEFEGALVRARTELAEAEARLVETRARITQEQDAAGRSREQKVIAEREVERLGTLRDRGATSDATLDASRNRLLAAQAAVESRTNQIIVLTAQLAREQASLGRLQWNVRKAGRDIENTTLVAPFGGLVSNVAAASGRLLNVNDRVATMVDLDRFEVRFTLSDAQYGRLVGEAGGLEGRQVEVQWKGGATTLQATGSIDRVSPVVTAGAGGFDVFARLQRSAATEAMRPGAFVTVSTPDIVYRGVVRLPGSAVHPGSRIFRIDEQGRLQPIEVAIVGYADGDVLVRGKIPDRSVLLTTRLPDAGPGVLVRVR